MDTEIKTKNKLSVLNTLLDDRCDLYGIKNTIAYLLDQGLTTANKEGSHHVSNC